jgi:uncharacterized RDD family membrane protein YckC
LFFFHKNHLDIILPKEFRIVYRLIIRGGCDEMKKIRIATPENIEVEYTLADVCSRVAAAVIDTLIQGIVMVLLAIALLMMSIYAPEFWSTYYGWIVGISILLYGIISYGYFIGMELNMNGQTLGKRVLGLRTIRNNGQPLTLKHSAIRNLFRIFIDNFGIGVIMLFFTKEHKRIGDFTASTIVVLEKKQWNPVTLEEVMNRSDNYSHYLSPEEQDILRDYLARKNHMEDSSLVKAELKAYFTKKFETLGILNEWQSFIDKI